LTPTNYVCLKDYSQGMLAAILSRIQFSIYRCKD